jgi:hypothetical protein
MELSPTSFRKQTSTAVLSGANPTCRSDIEFLQILHAYRRRCRAEQLAVSVTIREMHCSLRCSLQGGRNMEIDVEGLQAFLHRTIVTLV